MESSKSEPTRWTLIVRAQGSGEEARAALGELIGRYERFVIWLIRHFGHPPDVSEEDLKQEFLTGVLRRNDIGKLDRALGSFRSWLAAAVRNFLFNEWDKWNAATAGRKQTAVALFEAFHASTAEDELCARAFTEHTLVRTLEAQRAEARDKERFDVIARFLPGPRLDPVALGPLARSLGMKPTALAKAISLARVRQRELVRSAILDTLDLGEISARAGAEDPSLEARRERAVDEELRALSRCFDERETFVVVDPS